MTQNPLDRLQVDELKVPPRLLLGPGPSLVDPRVLRVMATPLLGHLDPCFLEIMDKTQMMLRYAYQTTNQLTFPVSGTGTAAMEASIANTVEPGTKVLVCINGYFSTRLAEMAGRYGADLRTIQRPWGDVFTPGEVDLALKEHPAKVVAIVHAETSTGAMQPLDEIVEVVHKHGAILIVDAVTSLGGVPILVDELGIDVCYSGAQKCLGSPPGSSPITVSPRAVEFLGQRKTKVSNFYLDLALLGNYWGPERMYHHTAPISSVYALYEALRIVAEEGLEARWDRHRRNAELLWSGLKDLGLEMHVPLEHRLPSLTTVRVPEGVDEPKVRATFIERIQHRDRRRPG